MHTRHFPTFSRRGFLTIAGGTVFGALAGCGSATSAAPEMSQAFRAAPTEPRGNGSRRSRRGG